MAEDHYRSLGISRQATTAQIRAAYRDLAWRLHPDRVVVSSDTERELAGRRMREVNEAWEVLGDAARRADYDHRAGDGPAGHQRDRRDDPGDHNRSGHQNRPGGQNGPGGGGASSARVGGERVHRSQAAEPTGMVHGHEVDGSLVSWIFRYGVAVTVVAVLVAIVVFTGLFGAGFGSQTDDGVTGTGDCILGITLVSCEDPHEFMILGFPDADGNCPEGQWVQKLARNVCTVPDN